MEKQFEKESFELLIDKGTLDSLLCLDNSSGNFETNKQEIDLLLSQM